MRHNISSRWGLVILALVSLTLLPLASVRAQSTAEAVQMTVTPYLNGHVKYGEWLPLRVNLSNDGPDVTAEVRSEIAASSGQSVYALPIPLPTGARKQADLYVLPSTFAQGITVRLLEGERILAETEVTISPHPHNEYLIGAVAADPDSLALLNGLSLPGRAQTRLIPLALDSLPERVEPLRSLDCIILTGVDTSGLTPTQGEALHAWIAQGGRLLIGGGASAQRTLSGLPEPLRPVQLGDVVELNSLPGLAEFTDEPIQVPGPFLAVSPTDHQGWPIITQDGLPLLIQQALGDGWIAYLSLDPSASPFDAWAGALPFWQMLLEPGAARPINTPPDIPARALESEQMNYALSNLPALELPSIRWMGLLFGVYVLLVGPVNYLLLRRWRKLDLAWVTIPALTLAFSVGGYGLGYRMRGNDVIINQISILPLPADGGRAAVRSYVGIFSPTRGDYDVQVAGDALVSLPSYNAEPWRSSLPPSTDGGAINVIQGNPTLVRNLSVNQWAMQTFQAETWLDVSERTIESHLTIEENRVRGTLHNHMERPLREVILLSGYRYARLGDWEAGEEREVEVALQGTREQPFPWVLFEQFFQGPNPPPREMMRQRSILEAYFHTNWGPATLPPTDLTLLAWTDLAPVEVQTTGRATRLQTTLVVGRQPLDAVDGNLTLPPGSILGRVVRTEGNAGECGPTGQVYVAQGLAELEYQLPVALRGFDLAALTLQVSVDGGMKTEVPSLALYDWRAAEWTAVQHVELEQSHSIPDPGRYVNPVGGVVRLQAQQNSFQGLCYRMDLGAELVAHP